MRDLDSYAAASTAHALTSLAMVPHAGQFGAVSFLCLDQASGSLASRANVNWSGRDEAASAARDTGLPERTPLPVR